MTGRRKPFTQRERRAECSADFGRRPLNNWGDGDLPAPWACGDVVRLRDAEPLDRDFLSRLDLSVRGRTWVRDHGKTPQGGRNISFTHGFFIVCTAFSVDDGDGWYFRVTDLSHAYACSDRLHVFHADRCNFATKDVDFMAPFDLVETADPAGLDRRERLLASGWTMPAVAS